MFSCSIDWPNENDTEISGWFENSSEAQVTVSPVVGFCRIAVLCIDISFFNI